MKRVCVLILQEMWWIINCMNSRRCYFWNLSQRHKHVMAAFRPYENLLIVSPSGQWGRRPGRLRNRSAVPHVVPSDQRLCSHRHHETEHAYQRQRGVRNISVTPSKHVNWWTNLLSSQIFVTHFTEGFNLRLKDVETSNSSIRNLYVSGSSVKSLLFIFWLTSDLMPTCRI